MISRHNRAGLTALGLVLYGGPVLAGLARHGGAVLPVFAALFLLYVAASRRPDLSTGAGWAGLMLMALMQALLVLASYGLGALAAGVIGPVAIPLWGPIALSAVAAGFGTWAMRDAAEMEVMLAGALKAIEEIDRTTGADPWPDPAPEAVAAVDVALASLRALERPTTASVDPIMATLWNEAQISAFDPLYDAAGAPGPDSEAAVDLGLLRFVAGPRARHLLVERGEAALAPMLLINAADASVRAEARARLAELVADGAPVSQLPDPAWLGDLAKTFPGEGFEDLIALRQGA